jgi:hypothetical protein
MSIPVRELAISRFYVTSTGELRHIISLDGGKVTYASRHKGDDEVSWLGPITVGAGKFAREALRQIPKPPR